MKLMGKFNWPAYIKGALQPRAKADEILAALMPRLDYVAHERGCQLEYFGEGRMLMHLRADLTGVVVPCVWLASHKIIKMFFKDDFEGIDRMINDGCDEIHVKYKFGFMERQT